jgi:hypothetical protein
MVHLLPHWNWTSGTTVTVFAYSNCDSVELFLNDQSQGSKSMANVLNAEWNVPWQSGTLRADCIKGGTVAASDTIKTAGAPAKVALSADRNPIVADGKDMVFVTADVQDANGVFAPTANNSITFSVNENRDEQTLVSWSSLPTAAPFNRQHVCAISRTHRGRRQAQECAAGPDERRSCPMPRVRPCVWGVSLGRAHIARATGVHLPRVPRRS